MGSSDRAATGKSTLLRCINGLEKYNGGSITVEGKEIAGLSQKELQLVRKDMGMIFQNFNLLGRLNVYDNIALPLQFWGQNKNSKENHDRIMELLDLVGLKDKVNSYPKQLSGGQKQRVAIARALVLNPKILLCDEATSALDPQITKGILALLLKINKELGITIVVVTHQMEVVKEICNKVAFLKHGKMIATGKPEELFVAPNKDVQEFVGDSVEFLPKDGVNVRLFFNDETASDSAITHLAHELGINFGICQGKLENFRGTIMGSLVINVTEADRERVTAWLSRQRYFMGGSLKMYDVIMKAFGQTVYMVIGSTIFSVILGFIPAIVLTVTAPDGLRPNKIIYGILDILVNVFRSFPFIILMVIVIPFTRMIAGKAIGTKAALVPLTISAIPFVARVIESALRSVDHGLIEAARSFGAGDMQIIFRVYLKEALPAILSGITLTMISLIGYSAMGGAIGAGGLGDVAIRYGYQAYKMPYLVTTSIVLIIFVSGDPECRKPAL